MKRIKENKGLMLLIFLGIFSFAIGIFDNYRELWLEANGMSSITISRIITFSYIITALSLLFFSLKVSTKKLKYGIVTCLVLKLVIDSLLVCLNNSEFYFLIKFLMFFEIAISQIIISSIYPLMLNVQKDDKIYTNKEAVVQIFNKLGLFVATLLLGKSIINYNFDYNTFLLIAIIFTFLAFIVLINIDIEGKDNNNITLKDTISYFNSHKDIYLSFIINLFGSMTYSSILGMKMLTLTNIIGLSAKVSSNIILILGIISALVSVILVKYSIFKSDYINLFFKYGFRLILYLLIFIINNKYILLITILYLLLTDCIYENVISGYTSINIEEKYSLIYILMRYCSSLIGKSIGVFICGITFNLDIKYIGITTFIIGVILYILALYFVKKKTKGTLKI